MDNEENVEFAKWFDGELRRRGWSSAEFARRAEMHRGRVSEYRRGVHLPDTVTARRIAETLGVSPTLVLIRAGRLESEDIVDPEGERKQLIDLLKNANLDDPATVKVLRTILESLAAGEN